MPKRAQSYRSWQMEKIADPKRATSYLNAALQDSTESFLVALGKVAQARQMAKVAKDAGVQRETLYRSLSKEGNPTFETLSSILNAVGLRLLIGVEGIETISSSTSIAPVHASSIPNKNSPQEKATEDVWHTVLSGQDSGYSALKSDAIPFIAGNSGLPEGALLYAGCGNC